MLSMNHCCLDVAESLCQNNLCYTYGFLFLQLMDKQDDENNLRESRKILKPYRHLFSKPITVKRNEQTKMLFNIVDDRNTSNSCTQTSKTILELAKLEKRIVRDRSLSPDSLCNSPKKADDLRVPSRPVSEAETIALVKKESTYNLLRQEPSKSQQYAIQTQQEAPAPPLDYYDDFDEYTPEGSVYTRPPVNCNTALHSSQPILYTSSQNPIIQHIIPQQNSNVAAPYPPLYERQYIVANAHINQQLCAANAAALAYHEQAHAQQHNMVAPNPNATATAYLIQQQQLEHKLIDAVFPNNSLVNTFLAKGKNRMRYAGDQTESRPKQHGDSNCKQYPNSFRFKSRSYIDPSTCRNSNSFNHPQSYPNRSKFTLNDCQNQLYNCTSNVVPDNQEEILMGDDVYSTTNYMQQKAVSKSQFTQRRSNSFMMPTIASERRSCMQEVRQITRLLSPTIRGCALSPRNEICNAQSGIHEQQYSELQYEQERQFCQYQQEMQSKIQGQFRVAPLQSQKKIKVPYIDGSVCDDTVVQQKNRVYKEKIRNYSPVNMKPVVPKNSFEEDLMKIDQLSLDVKNSVEGNSARRSNSGTSIDSTINNVLTRIKNEDWNVALKGLAEVTELCRSTDASVMSPYMTTINQRLLDLLRSPRSHVCRTACQAAGHLFESMKDTRKPEFEDIVNTLLSKTADSNKFIRQDANLALDCMVTHISSFHAIKALCAKGPTHKNPLVRCATIRLIICAVVIAGPETILNSTNSDFTRKRVIVHLAKFIMDKNLDTRKYAERLFKVLNRERSFDIYLKRFLEKEDLETFRQNIKFFKK